MLLQLDSGPSGADVDRTEDLSELDRPLARHAARAGPDVGHGGPPVLFRDENQTLLDRPSSGVYLSLRDERRDHPEAHRGRVASRANDGKPLALHTPRTARGHTVPHPMKDLPIGTVKSIEREAGVKLG